MVEAVIVIPVLVLLWISLYYLGALFGNAQAAQEQARSCAWRYSANNCQAVPPGCEGVLTDATSAVVAPDVERALQDGADRALRGGDAKGIVGTIVGQLVAGPLMAAFTSGTDAKVERSVEKPPTYGKEPSVVRGSYHLACNLAPTSPEDMAKHAWDTLVDR
jgi:hypothetical protein